MQSMQNTSSRSKSKSKSKVKSKNNVSETQKEMSSSKSKEFNFDTIELNNEYTNYYLKLKKYLDTDNPLYSHKNMTMIKQSSKKVISESHSQPSKSKERFKENNNNNTGNSSKNTNSLFNFFNENHEVYYYNSTPIIVDLFTELSTKENNKNKVSSNSKISKLPKSKININFLPKRKFKDLTNDEKKYYIHNYLAWKENNLKNAKENQKDLIKKIMLKREVIKEVQANIFDKELNKEKSKEKEQDQQKYKEDMIKSFHINIASAKKRIEFLKEKIRVCEITITSYHEKIKETVNVGNASNSGYLGGIGNSTIKQDKNTIHTKKSDKKIRLYNDNKNYSLDEIIDELKKEKNNLKEHKKYLQNEISVIEENLKQLFESISILEIKPRINYENSNNNNPVRNMSVFK